jgi:UDP-N-acetylglucosamine-lysosomal-enzyme
VQEENQLIRSLLEDFYLSFFPKPSQFELAMNFRNRFHYLNDYHKWTRRRWFLEIVCYMLAMIALVGCSRMLCFRHRVKYAGKLVNGLFKN